MHGRLPPTAIGRDGADCSRPPPLHCPQYTSMCCAFPRHSTQPVSAAAREVSSCLSPWQDVGHGVLCPGCMASPPPRSGHADPFSGLFAFKPNLHSPAGAGISRRKPTEHSPLLCSEGGGGMLPLFPLPFFSPPPPSLFKSSFETKTSCSLKWTIRLLRQLQPESFSSWQEDQNYKTISLRQIMHSSSSFETKYDLQFNFP